MNNRWSLEDLYPSFESKEFIQDMEDFQKQLTALSKWTDENLRTSDNAAEKIDRYVSMQNDLGQYDKLFLYAELTLSVESENAVALKLLNQIEDMLTELAKPQAAFKAFLKEIGDISPLIKTDNLKEHQFYINEVKEESRYMLSEAEEVLLSKMKTTGSSAWTKLFEQLTSTHMVEVPKALNPSGLMPLAMVRNLAYSNDPNTRKEAYEAELNAYPKIDKAVAAALNAIKGEAINTAKIRGYESVLDMTIRNSRMERPALDAMLAAIKDSLPAFRKYYRHKAQLLGDNNGLKYYNICAPVGTVDITFTYEEAANFVVDNFSKFSKEMGDYAKHAFDHQWLDVEPREGKRGGAFCCYINAVKQSRVMANFSGSFDSVLTLAHELGHGYHGHCLKNATYLNSEYSMPIAETASTFCETLVFKAAANNASPAEKFMMLENSIASAAQVVVDIYSRFLFEDEVIRRREEGPLSVEELKTIMADAIRQSYGDGLDPATTHPYMWLCKPHYYDADSNYYNFPYAYGQLFSNGLYGIYLEEGDSFIPKYNNLLEATGRNSLRDIGGMCGIDVHDKDFWTKSLGLIAQDIEEFMAIKLS